MSYRYCINGRFLARQITGVDRYAREIVRELDSLLQPGLACLVVPNNACIDDQFHLENINIVRVGRRSGHLWEQLDFAKYVRKENSLAINLCNTAPLFNPGIVTIHDMNVRVNPNFYSKKFVSCYKVMFGFLTKNAKAILTDSFFSQSQIERYYPASLGKMKIVPCSWQHIEYYKADPSVLDVLGLKENDYYFAMSSLAPNKNLRWIVETARLNPDETFVVAGGINTKVFGENNIPEAENVIYAGYVTDEEAKGLMAGCKAFLYPTFYEGFGLPPMEALASGARYVVVSDTNVMHEVYGDSVSYIDPSKPEVCLEAKLSPEFKIPSNILLKKYSWRKSAEMILDTLNEYD